MTTTNPELAKYEKAWTMPQYRDDCMAEEISQTFLREAKPKPGQRVLDCGCGSGRGAVMLSLLGRVKVTLLDFAENCLDEDVRECITNNPDVLSFVRHDIEQPLPETADYAFCCEVMEHIPEAHVAQTLKNILQAAPHCFFSIATFADKFGPAKIGAPLHVTVHPFDWWMTRFLTLGCVVLWSKEEENRGLFYVTLWEDADILTYRGVINTPEDAIKDNIRHNMAQGWQTVAPHQEQDTEVMIVGGGPTLNGFTEEIQQHRAEGVKLVTLNGGYNWCLERNLTPSATIIVDAREFNQRFVRPVVDGCKYLMASQVHPSVLEGLPKDRTYLWHAVGSATRELQTDGLSLNWGIPGGSTVLLRAIPLLRQLGYKRFHLYGCDSCLTDDKAHHAYAQPENDQDLIIPMRVTASPRIFYCHTWMASQAQEFLDLVKRLGDEFELTIAGDGLLAHILNTGASLEAADAATTTASTDGG